MRLRLIFVLLLLAVLLSGCNIATPVVVAPTQSPATDTPAAPATATATPPPTNTPAPPTPTPSATLRARPTASLTPLPTPTFTAQNGEATPTDGCTPFVNCAPQPVPASKALEKTENILLLGSDLRPGDNSWRTDTLLLVAIDHENNRVGILSFPRDYWLYIPGYVSDYGARYQRINQVDFIGERVLKHPEGGFGLLKEIMRDNFGIRIDRFARLHRQGFVDIVDTLGGIDINLDCELWELSPTDGKPGFKIGNEPFYVLYLPAGPNHLDGETALQFTTYRYNSADWDRARRQQQFLLAAREQFVRAGTLTQIPRLWGIFKDYFKTNLGLLDLIRLAGMAGDLDTQSVHARVIDYTLLDPVTLRSGAAVVTAKGNSVLQAIEGLFDAPAITHQTKPSQGCLPRPKWGDAYLKKLKTTSADATPVAPTTPEPTPTAVP